MEKPFDNRVLLVGEFDFTTCQRPDGTYYGHGGAQCHKGSPSQLPTKPVSVKVSDKTAALVDKYVPALESMYQKPMETKDLVESVKAFNADTAVLAETLRNGDLTYEELENFAVNANEGHDIRGASFVVRGMEPGWSGDTSKEDQYVKFGEDLAIERSVSRLGTPEMRPVVMLSQISQSEPGSTTWGRTALEDTKEAAGRTARSDWATFSGKFKSTAEMLDPAGRVGVLSPRTYMSSALAVHDYLPMRGKSLGDDTMYKVLRQQKDPRVKAVGTRNSFMKAFAGKRDQKFLDNLSWSAQNNPNFRGGMAAPGKDAKRWKAYQDLVARHRANGGKVYRGTFNAQNSTNPKVNSSARDVNNVETLVFAFPKRGGGNNHFVVPRMSANANGVKSDTMKEVFTQMESQANKGQLEEVL